ncbi:thiol peroxidase [Corynebacterium flavescens]|uniref:thiol peroxidase n=1 Tax=Corynebacterium flavescens TaxID=28028 RepID=UPI002649E88E|nr:thiol peroxidase [Corynebacterium flavescens]MDN6431053.1 thiol peroxidase [Corynebacterium flavescens]MDN6474716.1 thiol peroxidase [Corynebacterium flavescens]MDN6602249.1 thiol peroxidase [Corynebacterium flavescens]MDN6688668.1 thiol peroxidase [Corynebacterium flavescens]MDN6823441.1 thiol peroxidase [Corynebacterium flavescens]
MATVKFDNQPAQTVGDLPAVGDAFPDVELVGTDLSPVKLSNFAGKRVVVSLFPSVDTGVCAAQLRAFNEKAAGLENTVVLSVSRDLPFAQARFCAAEGIENVVSASDFRSDLGDKLGISLADTPLKGLLARSVFVLDENHKIVYVELVPEVTTEPNYDAALEALHKLDN